MDLAVPHTGIITSSIHLQRVQAWIIYEVRRAVDELAKVGN